MPDSNYFSRQKTDEDFDLFQKQNGNNHCCGYNVKILTATFLRIQTAGRKRIKM
jgi:hypothetical protein